jgi:hypothetical protein
VVSEIEVLDVEPGEFWFGAFRNLNVIVWHTGASVNAVRRLDRTNPARTQAHPERISTAYIAMPTATPPSAEARDALNAMHNQWGHTVGAGVVVIERAGLVGLAIRSAVTGMIMLAPKHYRVKVCDSVDVAAPWLAEHHARSTGVEVAADDLLAVLRHARTAGTAA